MTFFLGIDGGGTKTRCVLGDESAVLASGSGSGCNVLRVGEACARDSLAGAIHEACVQGGVSPQQISRTCAGISGAADDGVASLVQRLLIEIIGGAIEVIGDMEIALESAFGGEPGIVIIAGTGAIAYGRNSRGETARASGWGRMVSDEGSGHWIGVQAIGAALRSYDAGKQTPLLRALLEALDAKTVHDLVVRVNGSPAPDFAALFPVVLAVAEDGDKLAAEVLERAGSELARTVATLVERLFPNGETQVAMHGGVILGSDRVRTAFAHALHEFSPQATLSEVEVDPALGALQRARREFGIWHKQPGR